MDRPADTTPVPSARRAMATLGLATLTLVTAAAAFAPLWHLVTQRVSDLPDDVPYPGWQVDVVEGGLAVLLLAVALLSGRALGRRWRAARTWTPYRLAPVLLAVLPGLLLGVQLETPFTKTVGWASDHTAAAATARAELAAWRAAYRKAPPAAPSSAPPAPAVLAARLLRRGDLGAGWYDQVSPSTRALALSAVRPRPMGLATGGSTTLQASHWNGQQWVLDAMLLESLRRFTTPAQAAAYLDGRWANDLCYCKGDAEPWSVRHLGAIRIWRQPAAAGPDGVVPPPRTEAGFRVGTDVFTLRYSAFTPSGSTTSSSRQDPTPELTRLAGLAMRRAMAG